jgi:lysophospholipase L1-like esterase
LRFLGDCDIILGIKVKNKKGQKMKRCFYVLVALLALLASVPLKASALLLPELAITSNNYSKGDKISLEETRDLTVGDELQLYAISQRGRGFEKNPKDFGMYVEENVSDAATWTSSNNNIATVDNGLVTGVSEGSVTITAKVNDKSASYLMNVGVMDFGRIVFIGDSYCRGWNIKENQASPELSWTTKTIDGLGLKDSVVSCQGGSGISVEKELQDGTKIKYMDLLNRANEDVTDKNDVRWVVVMGGYNDKENVNNKDLLMNEGNSLITTAKEYFPNAQVVIGMYGWHNTNATIQSQMDVMIGYYKELAQNNGVLYMDDVEDALRGGNDLFTSDNYHPNENGQKLIADRVMDYLTNNTANVVFHNYFEGKDDGVEKVIYIAGLNNQRMASRVTFYRDWQDIVGWNNNYNSDEIQYSPDDKINDSFIKKYKILNLYAVWKPEVPLEDEARVVKDGETKNPNTSAEDICGKGASCLVVCVALLTLMCRNKSRRV